jgi:glycosyltransferase involved in cell wall biosynthesis
MRILFVHQSAELYGSDRTLLTLVEKLHAQGVECIVLLPSPGPLGDALNRLGIEHHVGPVGKLTRSSLSVFGLLALVREVANCMREIERLLGGRSIDIVHSNTVAVLGGAWWAKRRRVAHLWHVHELIVHPRIVAFAFPWLLARFADRVVCNSTLTREWVVREQPALADRTVTVWNGVPEVRQVAASDLAEVRASLGAAPDDVVITLAGRINRFKGQTLLVEATELLWASGHRNIRVVMIGGPPPGQEHLLHALQARIAQSPARDALQIIDFMDDITAIWAATDIGVVPSTEPEPFGLVAIEAMRAGKPVVAAAHGGLLDIVQDRQTGLLFSPGDRQSLSSALAELLDDEVLRKQMGHRGRDRQAEVFSLDAHVKAMLREYSHVTAAV